jgi:hypothetical protein
LPGARISWPFRPELEIKSSPRKRGKTDLTMLGVSEENGINTSTFYGKRINSIKIT